jgi:hypothetical protein
MSTQAAAFALVLFGAVMVATGKGGTLLWLPFKAVWAGLRLLGFRPRHLPALAATALLVFQATPTIGSRVPLALAVVGWLTWRFRPGRGQSPRWLRRAERKYADALRDAARNLRGRNRKQATPTPTTPTRPTLPPPARPTTPTRARPTTGRAPRPRVTASPRRARPAQPKPAASAPYWTPPPTGLDPVWPRWLGGGRRTNKRRQTP